MRGREGARERGRERARVSGRVRARPDEMPLLRKPEVCYLVLRVQGSGFRIEGLGFRVCSTFSLCLTRVDLCVVQPQK